MYRKPTLSDQGKSLARLAKSKTKLQQIELKRIRALTERVEEVKEQVTATTKSLGQVLGEHFKQSDIIKDGKINPEYKGLSTLIGLLSGAKKEDILEAIRDVKIDMGGTGTPPADVLTDLGDRLSAHSPEGATPTQDEVVALLAKMPPVGERSAEDHEELARFLMASTEQTLRQIEREGIQRRRQTLVGSPQRLFDTPLRERTTEQHAEFPPPAEPPQRLLAKGEEMLLQTYPWAHDALHPDSGHEIVVGRDDDKRTISVSKAFRKIMTESEAKNKDTVITHLEARLGEALIKDHIFPQSGKGWRMRVFDEVMSEGKRIGTGLRLSSGGRIGKVTINLNKLLNNLELEVKNDAGRTLMRRRNVPIDLTQMLTKRSNKKQVYGEGSKKLYREIIKHSGVVPKSNDTALHRNILIAKDPNELINRLEVGMGSVSAGNTSKTLKNEMMSISDYLLREGIMEQEDHRGLYHSLY